MYLSIGCQGLTVIALIHLRGTAVDDGRLDLVLNLTRAGSGGLELLDDVQALAISDLAEDHVLAVEPGGDDSGDKELGAVAAKERDMVNFKSC
jgi:hypothetical protein